MATTSYALITGASKGIGRSIAFELAKRKIDLLLVSRSADVLKDLAAELHATYEIKVDYLTIDLAQVGAASRVKMWCEAHSYKVNILINNAGYGIWGRFESTPFEVLQEMLQLNMLTLVEMTHYFLPELKQFPQSYILNIGSTAAYQSVPTFGLYAASKAFVVSFSRSLSYELQGSNVSVTCVSPGPVNTGFVDRAGLQAIKTTAEKFEMQPDLVAKEAVEALFAKKTEFIPGILNKFSTVAVRFLPKKWIEKLASDIYKNA